MQTTDLHWLAGLLEGEGTFLHGAPSSPNNPVIRLHMTDEDVVARAAKLMGTETIQKQKPQKAHHKPSFKCAVFGKRAVELMAALAPLMGKRRQARITEIISRFNPNLNSERLLRHRKLTDAQVREARTRFSNGENGKALAAEYGVYFTGFYAMLRKENYKHVK